MSVEINCELCGSANYTLPAGNAETGEVVCNDCGAAQGTLAALQAALMESVVARSAEALRREAETLRGTLPGA